MGNSFQNTTAQWQCIWSPNRFDGDVQQDLCFFTPANKNPLVARGSRNNFDFDVLFSYIHFIRLKLP